MRFFIKPKYQYFILPFSFVFITVAAVLNFIINKKIGLAIKTLILVQLVAFFFLLLIPAILAEFLDTSYLDGVGLIIYYYIISIIISIYIIKMQRKVLGVD